MPDIRQITALRKESQVITTNLHELKTQVIHSHSVIKILSKLSKLTPDEIWLSYLSTNTSGNLNINGKAAGYESIKVFINNLENSKMFKQVKLITANSSGDKNESIDFSIEVMEP
jgi:Tfp pilus assembly protein PilN